jgi:hypothetical protein
MIKAEAAERNADKKEQIKAREKRIQTTEETAAAKKEAATAEAIEEEAAEEEEAIKEEKEAAEEAFRPPLSTAPAALAQSRADRKRAPIMKTLEAEMVPKRSKI